jgi:hypothetical protein
MIVNNQTLMGEHVAGSDAEYFLSCYLVPPGELSVLLPRHDQNVALWRMTSDQVDLVRFWEVERHSGQKHHHWPLYTVEGAERLLNHLLAEEGLTLADISAVWGTPGLPGYEELCVPKRAEVFPLHSLGHLFSGILLDSEIFNAGTIVAMAVDNGPDFAMDARTKRFWYAGCVVHQGRLLFLPVESAAPLYAAATELFGREPGTLMALASACSTEIDFDARAAVGSIRIFGGRVPPQTVAVPFVQSIVDEVRAGLAGRVFDDGFTEEEHLCSAVMTIVQRCCELISIRNVERICARAGVDPTQAYLSLSGGFALNCPTNSLLLDHFGFKGLLTPPCANDSGQALGIGLLGLHGRDAFARRGFRLDSAYYGSTVQRLPEALAEYGAYVENVSEFSADQFVSDLVDGPIAWLDGAGEMGPRALGHRSLLGDPRTLKTKDLLNKHKQRQWWRPVAPIVLAEHVTDWFDRERPSPYMLETADVRPEVRAQVPAIVHLDGSARHQTLTREVNPLLHEAIAAFHESTGVPIVCNTSLNDKNEPIVNTAAEGLNFCIRKGISVAYVDGQRIQLRWPADDGLPALPHVRDRELFAGQEDERDRVWREWTGRGYTDAALFLLSRSPELLTSDDGDLATAERINSLAEYGAKNSDFAHAAARYAAMYGPGTEFTETQPPLPD